MQLSPVGHPLHTRVLDLEIRAAGGAALEVAAELLDVRKRGFVPVAGKLQTAGPVHHMRIEARIDAGGRCFEAIRSTMPRVAFESSEITAGESCRDVEDRLATLSGRPLTAFSRVLSETFGGPRGCSHVLSLARLVASSAAWLLDRERPLATRRAGELVFDRTLVIDGSDGGDGTLDLALQQTDLHCRAAAPLAPPMERFGRQLELRAQASVDLAAAALTRASGGVRERDAETLETARFQPLDRRLEVLIGHSLFQGFAARCLDAFGADPVDAPVLDGLLNLAPAFTQCMGSMSEDWPAAARRSGSRIGTGGHPDACYMWRRDGALGRQLAGELAEGRAFFRARAGRRSDGA